MLQQLGMEEKNWHRATGDESRKAAPAGQPSCVSPASQPVQGCIQSLSATRGEAAAACRAGRRRDGPGRTVRAAHHLLAPRGCACPLVSCCPSSLPGRTGGGPAEPVLGVRTSAGAYWAVSLRQRLSVMGCQPPAVLAKLPSANLPRAYVG